MDVRRVKRGPEMASEWAESGCWWYNRNEQMYRHTMCRKLLEGTACRTLASAQAPDPTGHPREPTLPALPGSPLHPSLRDCVRTFARAP